MDYKGAGVLIYKIDNQKIFFLLGKENLTISDKCNKENKYCDFGGKASINDSNYIDTASRSFYEDTMGTFYTLCEMRNILTNCPVYFNEKYKYHQFILNLDIPEDKITTYNKVRSYLKSSMKIIQQDNLVFFQKIPCSQDGYVEKSEIRWFELNEILSNHTIFKNEFINTLLKIFDKDVLSY